MKVKEQIAEQLMRIEAIKLSPDSPFTWASGWKSPIYCDNRVTLSFPDLRSLIKDALVETIKEHYPEIEGVAGVATAGIPQGALVAHDLDLPFCYVRPKPKSHGMGNQIEGRLIKGQKVVMVEDLISTGGSSLKAVEVIREAGAEVIGLVAIFTYDFQIAKDNFRAAEVPYSTLSDYPTLISYAKKTGTVQGKQLDKLNSWRRDPANWKP